MSADQGDVSRPRRIGLVGGSFDPPHLGHLVVAECPRVELGPDEVRLLVAGSPWMKSTVSDAVDRVARVAAAVAGHMQVVAVVVVAADMVVGVTAASASVAVAGRHTRWLRP